MGLPGAGGGTRGHDPIHRRLRAVRRGWALRGSSSLLGLGAPAGTGAGPYADADADAAPAGAATATATSSTRGAWRPASQVTIRYCNDQQARITEPASLHGPAPAAVYVHGGSWVSGDYDTGGFIIDRIGPALAARGFVVVSLDYRLGPRRPLARPDRRREVRHPVPARQRRHFHIDPTPSGPGARARAVTSWPSSARPDARPAGTSAPTATSRAGCRRWWTWRARATSSTMGNQGDAVLVAESFISLLGNVPSRQLGADLKKASPTTYVRQGRPALLDPRLEQRRDRLPGAVATSWPGTSGWPASRTS